jgi:hypothetical protein
MMRCNGPGSNLFRDGGDGQAERTFPVRIGGDETASQFDANVDHCVLHAVLRVHQNAVRVSQQSRGAPDSARRCLRKPFAERSTEIIGDPFRGRMTDEQMMLVATRLIGHSERNGATRSTEPCVAGLLVY